MTGRALTGDARGEHFGDDYETLRITIHTNNNPPPPPLPPSPVGDQGGCGDCYAWSAGGIANERMCRTGSNGVSVRQLACEAKDFMKRPGAGGCKGGWVDRNLDYLASDGVCKVRRGGAERGASGIMDERLV